MKIELNEKQLKSLYKAFTVLESEEEVRRFLFDLCTKNELAAMAQRLRVAEMLTKKRAYNALSFPPIQCKLRITYRFCSKRAQ